ncbi:hypothetical protein MPTK2_4g91000P [Marchantia polymorpha subsp. ruderalis]
MSRTYKIFLPQIEEDHLVVVDVRLNLLSSRTSTRFRDFPLLECIDRTATRLRQVIVDHLCKLPPHHGTIFSFWILPVSTSSVISTYPARFEIEP